MWFERCSVSKHALDFHNGQGRCFGSTPSTNSGPCIQLLGPNQSERPPIRYRLDDWSRSGRWTSSGLLSAYGSLGPEKRKTEICSSEHIRTAFGTNGPSRKLPQAFVFYTVKVWNDDNHCVDLNICAQTTPSMPTEVWLPQGILFSREQHQCARLRATLEPPGETREG